MHSIAPTTIVDDVADNAEEQVDASNNATEQETLDASESIPSTAPETAEGRPSKKLPAADDVHLPFARVQRIIKADKKIGIVAKDATQLIAFATEEFIKRITQTARRKATGSTIMYHDLTSAAREDEFRFLEEIFEWLPLVLEQERELQRQKMQKKPKPKKKTGDEPPEPNEDSVPAPPVIHNSDGTMTYAEDGPGDSEEEMT
ncbi:hypothetical protein PC9H_011069 [Pleurotus ostreatus]|uniref:Transcription factor CBF/NF-Y/archaeal histone domain-containing protein n=2 Tax=Pleurotus TaxID=5320 RepID=A0A8H6ZL21_PLEOS|nr:uncharacterized protein PC9H_011069 [Pleurotus ostreatus]KAF7422905.1 hypothetical protein PC9H_011069 [Pleurotus ostreatus]KAG9227250.1 hypothetical protein CCMSSC00406_0004211 [Pleurotus cornucopiae]KAJ8691127.1 hypothetical protein PTI98_010724 [Pleurotus ostreatus]